MGWLLSLVFDGECQRAPDADFGPCVSRQAALPSKRSFDLRMIHTSNCTSSAGRIRIAAAVVDRVHRPTRVVRRSDVADVVAAKQPVWPDALAGSCLRNQAAKAEYRSEPNPS
jgi:hypothetical protein